MTREYDAQNEQRECLLEHKKNNRGDYLKIDKITNYTTNTVRIDIRNYYTNEEGEILPTSKGVRFNKEKALDIVTSLLGVLEANELQTLQDKLGDMIADI